MPSPSKIAQVKGIIRYEIMRAWRRGSLKMLIILLAASPAVSLVLLVLPDRDRVEWLPTGVGIPHVGAHRVLP